LKLNEAFAKAFFYTKLGWGNYISWWLGAIAYTLLIYMKRMLGLINKYLKFKKG